MIGKVKLHGFILVKSSLIALSGTSCLSMISGRFAFVPRENRRPLFRIMLAGKVERIYRQECVRNLTEKEISLKNQDPLKAKSARHHSL
jgi:hypothetical protein